MVAFCTLIWMTDANLYLLRCAITIATAVLIHTTGRTSAAVCAQYKKAGCAWCVTRRILSFYSCDSKSHQAFCTRVLLIVGQSQGSGTRIGTSQASESNHLCGCYFWLRGANNVTITRFICCPWSSTNAHFRSSLETSCHVSPGTAQKLPPAAQLLLRR